MIDEDAHNHEMEMYSPWSWIAGLAFGGFLTYVMFALSDGFA